MVYNLWLEYGDTHDSLCSTIKYFIRPQIYDVEARTLNTSLSAIRSEYHIMVKFSILWYPQYAHCSPWPTKKSNRIINVKVREIGFTLILVSLDSQRS